jgi:hypothetical protein
MSRIVAKQPEGGRCDPGFTRGLSQIATSPVEARLGYPRGMPRALAISVVVALLACGEKAGETTDAATSTTATSTGGGATTTTPTSSAGSTSAGGTTSGTTTGSDGVDGLELMPRFLGLWSGPASMTPLGTFPLMNMDVRAASGHVLFGRVDLDEDNSLRFAFEVEAPGGEPTLVYRNGGYFLGLLRDSRAALVEHTADTWRFCSTSAQGCDYIDATFTFTGDTELVFDTRVKGAQHVYWQATRKETRTLPDPFPVDLTPEASDAPFPPMPTLVIDVTWTEPLMEDGEVWVILSTTNCDTQLSCTVSRSLRKTTLMDDTAATLTIDQIHAGDYKLNAVLDRNGNFATTQFPDSGDGIGLLNKAIKVADEGETKVSTAILITL